MRVKPAYKIILTGILLGLFLIKWIDGASNRENETYQASQFLFDTEVYIEVYGRGAESAGTGVIADMARLDKALDRYDPQSELARINVNAGNAAQSVSPETFSAIQAALEVARMTDGYFNPAIGPLVDLWQRAQAEEVIPDPQEIRKLLPLTDYQAIELDEKNQTVFLPAAGMSLDLGGIAKGFAVERAVSILKDAGIASAMVTAGGNVYSIGNKPDGTPWRVGIRNPQKTDDVVGFVELHDQDIDTSGDYEHFFTVGGKTYGHILDPTTGYPSEGVISCSILADRPVLADGLATAIFAMGVEKGQEKLETLPVSGAMIIAADGTSYTSKGFEQWLVTTPDGNEVGGSPSQKP